MGARDEQNVDILCLFRVTSPALEMWIAFSDCGDNDLVLFTNLETKCIR